jgi:uncharacterized protein DUF3800
LRHAKAVRPGGDPADRPVAPCPQQLQSHPCGTRQQGAPGGLRWPVRDRAALAAPNETQAPTHTRTDAAGGLASYPCACTTSMTQETAPGDQISPLFFVLGGFGIDANDVPSLKSRIREVAFDHAFCFDHPAELKFSHVGKTRNTMQSPNWMIRASLREPVQRRALVYACFQTLCEIESVKVIVVAVDQRLTYGERSPILHAVQPLFERINLDCVDHGAYGLVVCDEEETEDRKLRQATRTGSFYVQFSKLIDTISFMPSEESMGVQMADLIAGAFSRYLNSQDPGYVRIIWPKLRSNRAGRVNGFGIKVYPSGLCPVPHPLPAKLSDFDAAVEELVKRPRGPES